jgi:hypothetical protein
MTQLTVLEAPSTEAVPYVRGVPAEVVARGVARRFIPASAGIMSAFALIPIMGAAVLSQGSSHPSRSLFPLHFCRDVKT